MKVKTDIKHYFLYLILLFIYADCNIKYNECSLNKNIINYSPLFSSNDYDYNTDIDFDPVIVDKIINIGKIQDEILNSDKIYKFTFNSYNINANLLVHFYPLDCKIKIAAKNENGQNINILPISNYDNNAYVSIIPKEQLSTTYFKIMPLINPLDNTNKYRDFHLTINSFENNSNPRLFLKEKVPTIIYFNTNLTRTTILYDLKNENNLNPIIFSFFIKERVKFEVEILDGENPNRIIGYKDNIVINPKSLSKHYSTVYITINKMNDDSNINNQFSTMVIQVIEDNLTPFYLQQNLFHLGFMPINHEYHNYYMEIYNGEEGEIMLHNKRYNGILTAKIIEKTKEEIGSFQFPTKEKRYEFLKNNNYLKFNEYSQKLSFTSSQTYNCTKGCYILINYYCPNFGMENVEGSEYTLLSRVWDEEEYRTQIIYVPLDEYIFGSFELFSINIDHYYSVYIPEDNNFTIEIQGSSIKALSRKGKIKIKFYNNHENIIELTQGQNETIILKLNKDDFGLKTLKDQYLSFAFSYTLPYADYSSENLFSNYYFRIVQGNSNKKYIIYPLDTNKANLCQTSKFQVNKKDFIFVCYFLLKNDYKELNYDSYIYSYGINETNYKAWFVKENDYYSIDIDNIKKKYTRENVNVKTWKKGFLKLYLATNETKYILVEIKSLYEETLTVLFNFNTTSISPPFIDIFSYQAFYLSKRWANNINFNFNFNLFKEYRIFLEFIKGEGYICLKENCKNKLFISKKIFLSTTISKENNYIYLNCIKYLFFNIKIYNQIPNDFMEEVNYGYNIKDNNKGNIVIAYFIKDIYNKGIDINFYFQFENENQIKKFEIKGYTIDYEDIKYITTFESLSYYLGTDSHIKGYFDYNLKTGLLVFDKEKLDNKIIQKSSIKSNIKDIYKDKYYLITISNIDYNDNMYKQFDFSLKMYAIPKNNSQFILPINEYIRGSFDLLNNTENQSQVYYIQIEGDEEGEEEEEESTKRAENSYILEFSSNYQNIELIFNKNLKYYSRKIYKGYQQYFFYSKDLINNTNYSFIVQINNKNMEKVIKKKYVNKVNYILKFYSDENELNQSFILDKSSELQLINDTSENKTYFNIHLKNNYETIEISNYYNYTYTYLIRLYLKKCIYEDQILNTTAIISYDVSDYDYPVYYSEYITDDLNDEFSMNYTDLLYNEDYILYLFIKIDGKNGEEQYYSNYFIINPKLTNEKSHSKKDLLRLIIILSVSLGIVIILFIIIMIGCIKIRKKNKSLEEKVLAISFTSGIDEDSLDKKKSKKDEDYETTFI